jgi:uncharacterized Zn finger protein (UPF0148 family)
MPNSKCPRCGMSGLIRRDEVISCLLCGKEIIYGRLTQRINNPNT